MRMILAYAATMAHRLFGRGGDIGKAGLVCHRLADHGGQPVQRIKHTVAATFGRGSKLADTRTGLGQRSLAEERPQGHVPGMAPDHPCVVFGLHDTR